MRLGRLEIYRDNSSFAVVNGSCECLFLWTPIMGFTWLGDECYGTILERKGKALKRVANIRRIRLERESVDPYEGIGR